MDESWSEKARVALHSYECPRDFAKWPEAEQLELHGALRSALRVERMRHNAYANLTPAEIFEVARTIDRRRAQLAAVEAILFRKQPPR